jgi:integrase
MSVTVREYKRGKGWEVDVIIRLPDGLPYRERRKAPASSKSEAQRWGENRVRHLLQHGRPQHTKEVPTLAGFAPRFIAEHPVANRHKASGIAAKEMIVRVHLVPALGDRRLDTIHNEDIQRLKLALRHKAPKTVNNVLTVLSVLLKKALEWGELDRLPCVIKLLKVSKSAVDFYDFAEYERMIVGARATDWRAELLTLLGGEAGLRSGEMAALEWSDIDFHCKRHGQITVQRSAWKNQIDVPKSGRIRFVPLTRRLAAALREHRHLRGARVLHQEDGSPLTEQVIQTLVRRAARRAGLRSTGPHMLRHTFCSHLAMRGASARAIQEAAGHQDLATTQRYMHISPGAVEAAIGLLDQAAPTFERGDIVETASEAIGKLSR